jgi:hypothetical protein
VSDWPSLRHVGWGVVGQYWPLPPDSLYREAYPERYLVSAVLQAQAAEKWETADHTFDAFPNWWGSVTGAVNASCSFLEATINETVADWLEGRAERYRRGAEGLRGQKHENGAASIFDLLPVPDPPSSGERDFLERITRTWELTGGDRLRTLAKYELVLSLANLEPFDRGAEPYQSARCLIDLRNELVHPKARDVSADKPHPILARLRSRFTFGPGGPPGTLDEALNAACARWACTSARALTDAFATRLTTRFAYMTLIHRVWPWPS